MWVSHARNRILGTVCNANMTIEIHSGAVPISFHFYFSGRFTLTEWESFVVSCLSMRLKIIFNIYIYNMIIEIYSGAVPISFHLYFSGRFTLTE